MVTEAIRLNRAGATIYINLNKLNEHLHSRHANRIQEFAPSTATDADVTRRCWLLVDLDPQRPKDTSATQEQVALVIKRAAAVRDFLKARGWSNPVSADSGNGLHFLYPIDLPNDESSRDLIKGCLEALAGRFDDEAVKVDRSVFNSARIVKLYGTVANKGDNVPIAPWRLSKLRVVPDEMSAVSLDTLRALAALATKQRPRFEGKPHIPNGRAWSESDMQDFLARGGNRSGRSRVARRRIAVEAEESPFNPDHGFGEAAVFLRADGILGFCCKHNSCQGKHWSDLRSIVDGKPEHRQDSNAAGNSGAAGNFSKEEWPQPQQLPDGLPPVMPFDYELLPPALHRLVEDISERMQCPPDFHGCAHRGIVVAGRASLWNPAKARR